MNSLDFLSNPPTTFIFEKKSNKTNLGGVFTLILLFIIFIISTAYIYDYIVNPKYVFSYTYDQLKDDLDENDAINNSNFNPTLQINFRLYNSYAEKINFSNFLVTDYKLNPISEFNRRVSNLTFQILYKCENESFCEIREEDKSNSNFYQLMLIYNGSLLDHQNSESPIKECILHHTFHFVFNEEIRVSYLNWKTIKYIEEEGILGIFGNSNDVYGGYFAEENSFIMGKDNIININGTYYRHFIIIKPSIQILGKKSYYELYSRRRKNIFDPIANICSLTLTIYNCFAFIFCGYYSNNFDNYKIIEKIVSNKSKYNNKGDKKKKEVELTTILLDKKEHDKVIFDSINEINNDDDNDKKGELELNEKKVTLPKLHFYDFFYGSIDTKNYFKMKKQQIILICNEIIFKYFSLENILYNQLILDNLLKDYKWNDPNLNNIENNELFIKLKTYI